MRRIFIDCGANDGLSVDLFMEKFPNSESFEIYSFEPHPRLFQKLSRKTLNNANLVAFNLAVHNKDAYQKFYLGKDLSSSLRSDKTSGGVNPRNFITVKTISLSNFIKDNFSIEDKIVLKLDIEGSEYDVLLDLMNTSALDYIDELYGEYHFGKLKEITENMHNSIIERLLVRGYEMKDWCAEKKIIGNS